MDEPRFSVIYGYKAHVTRLTTRTLKYNENTGEPKHIEVASDKGKLVISTKVLIASTDLKNIEEGRRPYGNLELFSNGWESEVSLIGVRLGTMDAVDPSATIKRIDNKLLSNVDLSKLKEQLDLESPSIYIILQG